MFDWLKRLFIEELAPERVFMTKAPSNQPLVDLAKSHGLKIYAKHYRRMGYDEYVDPQWQYVDDLYPQSVWISAKEDGYFIPAPHSHGGKTTLTLVDPLEVAVVGYGEALCSDKDNFCRRRGFRLAFNRAWKEYEESLKMSSQAVQAANAEEL